MAGMAFTREVSPRLADCQLTHLDRVPIDEETVLASVKKTSRAVVTLCTGVAQWFRADGPLPAETVADRYVVLAQAMAQAAPEDRG